MIDVKQALQELVDKGGSDLHLKVGAAPLFRVNGELAGSEGAEPLTARDTEGALKQLLTDDSKLDEFAKEHEVDFSFELPDVARYRINAFQQRGVISMACRAIPHKISTIEELALPEVVTELAEEERGIVLLTGTTGSGKSTTLAAMIDHINDTTSKAHRHDRGPDRVPALRQALDRSTSARSAWTPRPSSARCGASCARTPT